jgi:hypothetical protein
MRTKLFDNPNVSDVTQEVIQSAFIVRLPFRLRVGSFHRHCLKLGRQHFEIALHNHVVLPEGTSLREIMADIGKKGLSVNVLNTDAIVAIKDPEVSEDTLNKLSRRHLDKDIVVSTGSVFKAIEALNRFIVAYATATRSWHGGEPLRRLQTQPTAGISDLNKYVAWHITILWPAGKDLPDSVFHKMFKLMPPHEKQAMGSVTGPISDLPAAELANIDKVLSLQEESIYLELAFEARSKYFLGDPKGGLLMAVAALEGAHAALVQYELMSRLSHKGKKKLSKSLASLPGEYLMRLGMSNCIYLTPYAMMDETEGPPDSLIQECARGLTIRNEIMHAKTNKQGQPLIRTRSFQEISEAYSAILKMYEYYIAALERRAETRNTETA